MGEEQSIVKTRPWVRAIVIAPEIKGTTHVYFLKTDDAVEVNVMGANDYLETRLGDKNLTIEATGCHGYRKLTVGNDRGSFSTQVPRNGLFLELSGAFEDREYLNRYLRPFSGSACWSWSDPTN